jgi:hypothetical protein
MRKFYSLITMLLIVTIASSQTTYNWNAAGGGSFATATNWTPNRSVPAATDILIFGVGASYTVTNVNSAINIGRISITAGTVTFSGTGGADALNISNSAGGADFIVSNGATLIQNANMETITLANNATADISGTFTENGTYNTDGIGVVSTVSATGIIDNRGTVTCTTPSKLQMSAGSQYLHARDGGNLPDATWNTSSTIEFTGVTATVPGNIDQVYGNFKWNNSLQTAALNFNDAVHTINGDFSFQNSGTGSVSLKNSGSSTPLAVAGDFNLSGGTLVINGTNNTQDVNVKGDVSISGGTLSRTAGNANFSFNGTTQSYTKTGGTISGTINFTINTGSTVNFGTSVLDGSTGTFTLSSAAKIITANANGLSATGSIQVTGTKSFNSGADYEFRGASTGTFTTTTNPQIANLIINNSGGNVTLAQPMTVNTSLTLTAGALLSTATNFLSLIDNATVTGASNSSYVSGPIRKTGNDAFTFPTGRVGAGYVPIAISAPGSTGTIMTAEYLRGTPPNATNITAAGIKHISTCDYWTLDQTGTASSLNVTLNWNGNNPCNGTAYVTDPTTIKAVHYNGTSWNTASPSNGTGSPAIGSVTWTGVTVFSPFALGTTATGNNNPLPVLFDNVKAFERSGGIQVEWSNLTERDLIEYVVERSTNGRDYIDYISLTPKSNLNEKADYSQFDATPVKGANFYRIRALEQSGKMIYSKVLRVEIGGTKKGFSIYPNPVLGHALTLSLTGVNQGTYNVRIVTPTGQDVFHKTIQTQASGITQTLELPSSMKPGVYTMVVNGDGYSQNQMFVVQ